MVPILKKIMVPAKPKLVSVPMNFSFPIALKTSHAVIVMDPEITSQLAAGNVLARIKVSNVHLVSHLKMGDA